MGKDRGRTMDKKGLAFGCWLLGGFLLLAAFANAAAAVPHSGMIVAEILAFGVVGMAFLAFGVRLYRQASRSLQGSR